MKISRLTLVGLLGIIGGLTILSAACHPSSASVTPSPSPTMTPQDTAVFVTSKPIPTSTPRPSPEPMASFTPLASAKPITLTIVYDNRSADARLGTAWGFACLIETGAETILFDTGGAGQLLMHNLTILGIDPQAIDVVVLSHVHSDHTGGLDRLLAANDRLTVYLPKSFPASFKARIHNPIVEVSKPVTIAEHIWTTGELGTAIIEQSLIIEAQQGLIVLTGCAHPGIVAIVRQAKMYGAVYLVMGGFHLAEYSSADVQTVIAELKALGVQQVAPSHCTGDLAIEQFRTEFGTGFFPIGAGATMHVER
jgi:7,8-dihydropterin-6-yl-methyl-4-(beta-D-ribofuranosyl)aminobenzene 5'-phosphate synthase